MSVKDGAEYVSHAAEICDSLGYSVFVPERETCGPWDLLVNEKRVQVKKRSVCTSKPNNIRLRTSNGPATDAYTLSEVDVFAIHWRSFWYVIPSEFLARQDGTVRNGIYMPDVAEWVNRWEVLDGSRVVYAMQKEFDF